MQPDRPVWVTALGGVGEVGKNATLLECDGQALLIDCGSQFPSPEHLGIDLIIPDFSYVTTNPASLLGVVLSHAHEDHIGAVPYFLRQVGSGVDLYGSNLTLAMVRARMRRRREEQFARYRAVEPGHTVSIGPFRVHFISVGHSVPDATALRIETPAGAFFFTGDFKFTTETGEIDRASLWRFGDQGVRALFSDCVRVEMPGRTPPESTVTATLDRVVKDAKGRVIVASFASNLSRIRNVLGIARENGRKVAIAGRGLTTSIEVASELGYIVAEPSLMISLGEADRLPAGEVLIIATGAQGEPTAALSRMAVGDHREIRVREGDTVVLSSTPVPGNEESVARTIDNLFRRGANVIWSSIEPRVHVSGHAAREELAELVRLLRPEFAVPLHGEYRMQVLYRRLAIENGVAPEKVRFLDIGRSVRFDREGATDDGTIPAGSVLVDGVEIGGVDDTVLRDRRHLSGDGIVIVSVAMARDTGEILRAPEVIARGVAAESHVATALDAVGQAVDRALRDLDPSELDVSFVHGRVQDVARAVFRQSSGPRPLILPVVVEV